MKFGHLKTTSWGAEPNNVNSNPFVQTGASTVGSERDDAFRATIRLAAIAAALVLLTVLTVSRSNAAFRATTSNTGDSFATGSVTLSDDDAGSTLFGATNMSPGNPVVECIKVTYAGSLLDADVKMYATSTGALDTYLDTTIEVGSGGGFGDCTTFSPSATIFDDTLENLSSGHANWSTGLPVYTATRSPESRTIRITVDVRNDPGAQNQTAGAEFHWEAQDV